MHTRPEPRKHTHRHRANIHSLCADSQPVNFLRSAPANRRILRSVCQSSLRPSSRSIREMKTRASQSSTAISADRLVELRWLLETGWANQLSTSTLQTKGSKERTGTSNVFWSHHQMARRSGAGCPNCVCNLVTSLITCWVTCSVEPPFELVQQLLLRHATVGRTYFFRMPGPSAFRSQARRASSIISDATTLHTCGSQLLTCSNLAT